MRCQRHWFSNASIAVLPSISSLPHSRSLRRCSLATATPTPATCYSLCARRQVQMHREISCDRSPEVSWRELRRLLLRWAERPASRQVVCHISGRELWRQDIWALLHCRAWCACCSMSMPHVAPVAVGAQAQLGFMGTQRDHQSEACGDLCGVYRAKCSWGEMV